MSADSRPQTAAAPVAAGDSSLPESISAFDVRSFLDSVGINPNNTRCVYIEPKSVTVSIYKEGEFGKFLGDDGKPATRVVSIPLVER